MAGKIEAKKEFQSSKEIYARYGADMYLAGRDFIVNPEKDEPNYSFTGTGHDNLIYDRLSKFAKKR